MVVVSTHLSTVFDFFGIALLSVVGKVFCKIERLDKGRLLHEGQAGFRLKKEVA